MATPHAGLALVFVSSVTALLPGLAFAWTTPLIPVAVGVLAALPVAGEGPQRALLGPPWHFITYTTTTSTSAALIGFAMVPSLWFASDHGGSARDVVAWADRLDYAGPALGGMWFLSVVLTAPVAWLAAAVSRRNVRVWVTRDRSGSQTGLETVDVGSLRVQM